MVLNSLDYILSTYKESAKKLTKNNDSVKILVNYFSIGALYLYLTLLLQIILISSISSGFSTTINTFELVVGGISLIATLLLVVGYMTHLYITGEALLEGKIIKITDGLKRVKERYIRTLIAVLFSMITALFSMIIVLLFSLIPVVGLVLAVLIMAVLLFALQITVIKASIKSTPILESFKKALLFIKKEPLLVFLYLSIVIVISIFSSVLQDTILSSPIPFSEALYIITMPLIAIFSGLIYVAIPIRLIKEKKI